MYIFSTVKSVTSDKSTGYSTVEVATKYFSYWLGFNSFAGTLAFGQLTVTNSKYEISKMFDFSRRLWVATALHILTYVHIQTYECTVKQLCNYWEFTAYVAPCAILWELWHAQKWIKKRTNVDADQVIYDRSSCEYE